MSFYKLTKAQLKNLERIEAWMKGQPFKENSRDKHPAVPHLSHEDVREQWVPGWNPSETGQFFTPREMAYHVANHYVPASTSAYDWRILEPCAGLGSLIAPLPLAMQRNVTAYEAGREVYEVGQRITPLATWHNDSPFEHMAEIEGKFDLVLCNPPFGTTWAMYEAGVICKSGATRSEHQFLELAIRALKPDGAAVFIAPYNLADKMPKAMKAWFSERAELTANEGPLPGKFQQTNIRVNAFVFTRTGESEHPVEAATIKVEASPIELANVPVRYNSGEQLALF
ncbi:MAG TPA: N-6 DNA methylase [Anaerolineales bacterium]|nr:N-6 DNA methylase [Anaerolineales bacterium]